MWNLVEVDISPSCFFFFFLFPPESRSRKCSDLFRSFQFAEHLQDVFLHSPRWIRHLIPGTVPLYSSLDSFTNCSAFMQQHLNSQSEVGVNSTKVYQVKKKRKIFSLFICTLWHYFNVTVLKKIAAVPAISTSLLKHFVKWVENGAVGHPTTFALTLIVQAVSCLQITLNKRWFSLKFSRQINFSSFLVKLSWKNRLF